MRRRRVLAFCGTLGLSTAAGCLNVFDETSSTESDTPTEGPTPTGNPEPTTTPDENKPTPAETDNGDEPTPTETDVEATPVDEHFLDTFHRDNVDFFAEYPEYGDGQPSEVVRLVPYEVIDTDEIDIFLEPSDDTVSWDGTIDFTLTNGTDRTFESGFYHWKLHKHVDGQWFNVKLSPSLDQLHRLNPDETHTWELIPLHDDTSSFEHVDELTPGVFADVLGQMDDTLYVPGLGGGQYAFGITGWFEDGSHNEETAFTTCFELDAPERELEPTAAIQDIEWNHETLHATTGTPDEAILDPPLVISIERVERSLSEAQRILIEQVWRYPPLWDALALAEEHDATRVELVEHDALRNTAPKYGFDPDSSELDGLYAFEQEVYELATSTQGS